MSNKIKAKVVVNGNKGGTGKSLTAQVAIEVIGDLAGEAPHLVEMEGAQRLRRLQAAGRVSSYLHVQVTERDALALLDDSVRQVSYWDEPAVALRDRDLIVVDTGAQGWDNFAMWLGLGSAEATLGQGEGLTFLLPTDDTADGEDEARAAAVGIHGALPAARIVAVANLGAGQARADRIIEGIRTGLTVVIPTAPLPELYSKLYSLAGGLYQLIDLSMEEARFLPLASQLGVPPSKLRLAMRGIRQWYLSVARQLEPILAPSAPAAAEAAE